jgi:hypothetical protein
MFDLTTFILSAIIETNGDVLSILKYASKPLLICGQWVVFIRLLGFSLRNGYLGFGWDNPRKNLSLCSQAGSFCPQFNGGFLFSRRPF